MNKLSSILKIIPVLLLSATILAACGQSFPASVKGECKIFSDPGFAPQGARPKDQIAIDTLWIEPGIGGCGWKRPQNM